MRGYYKTSLLCLASLLSVAFAVFEFAQMRAMHARVVAGIVGRTGESMKPPDVDETNLTAHAGNKSVSAGASDRLERLFESAERGPGDVPLIKPEDLFFDYPELREKFIDAIVAKTRDWYGAFFAAEGMTDEEIDRFCAIFGQREKEWAHLQAAKQADETGEIETVIQAEDRAARQRRQDDLRTLLGPDAYERFVEYRRTLTAHANILGLNTLIAASYSGDDPVSPEQIDRLAVLVTEAGIYGARNAAERADTESFLRVRSQVREILSPNQMEIFDLLLDHRQVALFRASNQ